MSGALLMLGGGGKTLPAFVNRGSTVATTGSANIPYPASPAAGNILIAQLCVQDGAGAQAITVPGGWTEIGTGNGGVNFLERVFWKIATGSESGSLAVTATGSVFSEGLMYQLGRCSSVEAGSQAIATANGLPMAAVNITTTGSNELALQIMSANSSGASIGNLTGESGTDYTEAIAEVFTTNRLFSLQVGAVPTATAITGGSVNLGANAINRCRTGVALIP